MIQDKIYVAGALNGKDSCEYLRNVARMNRYGTEIKKLHCSVFIPANDLILGLIDGKLNYEDYFQNSLGWLRACDAMALTPGYEQSKGTEREIKEAKKRGIPVLKNWPEILQFVNRPKILCIVGESGTGKTTIADYIEFWYNIPMIRSYTDREPRSADENSHTFLSKEQYDSLDEKDMLAHTVFGENRYCCLHSDIKHMNTYVIDENGLEMLKENHSDKYNIKSLRVTRRQDDRIKDVTGERIERDKNRFNIRLEKFDYIIQNKGPLPVLHSYIDGIVEDFFNVPAREPKDIIYNVLYGSVKLREVSK